MKCRCGAELVRVNKAGEPVVRSAGLVCKTDGGLAMICPRCKGDVPFTGEFARALQTRLALFFKHTGTPGRGF